MLLTNVVLLLPCLSLITVATGEYSATETLRFIGLGDWGEIKLPGQEMVAEQMSIWAVRHQPEFVVTTGDNIYQKGIFSPDDAQMEIKWREKYDRPGLSHLPWYVSVGNHDYGNTGSGNEWNSVGFSALEPRWVLPHLWYDFKYPVGSKDIHFIVFDTEGWKNGVNDAIAQEQWLEATLATSTSHWKVVVGHRPVYSAGTFGPTHSRVHAFLEPLFRQYKVDMFLCGHEHNLEHIAHRAMLPWDTDYVISGGGGGLWTEYVEDAVDALENEYDMELKFFKMSFGFVGFIVSEEEMRMEFIDGSGELLYVYSRTHSSLWDYIGPEPTESTPDVPQ